MTILSPIRRLMKLVHPEGIPWPGSVIYNALSLSAIFQKHYELVAKDILSYSSQGALLDIGTGPAWLLLKIHKAAPQMRLTGIDSSAAMVTQARQNILAAGMSDSIEVRQGSAEQIPFTDGSFDVVVSTASMHHWKQPSACFNEVYRVLKKSGYVLIYDLVSDTPAPIMEKIRKEFGRWKATLFWLHSFEEPFYSQKNFASLAENTSFRKKQAHFVGLLYCLVLKKDMS